ncbi:MAG: MATE family efflux transporter [Acidobacteriia bacterium]|nr:MATE family efflux transporter [Terriglobia bacterium]
MWELAWPLIVAELGWMLQGILDLVMAGPLGTAAIGACTLGNMIFYPVAVSGTGVLMGMDTLVSQAFGASDPRDCRKSLLAGMWLSFLLTPLVVIILWALIPLIRAAGTNPHVLAQFAPYLRALTWSILPLLLYSAFRRYLQAVNVVKPITISLVGANLVNIVGNWALMYGHLGAPAMGLEGSGWSTVVARLFMAGFLLATILWHEYRSGWLLLRISWRPEWGRMRLLVFLGLPAAGQIAVEGGIFSLVTVMAGKMDEVSLAAHSIVINVVSTTFMVPLGISSAAAVRVGQAFGRKDLDGVARSGWTAILFGAVFMASAGLALWFIPRPIVAVYSSDAAVLAAGAGLLRIAAFFQLFDGLQVVTTGALRGLGDTRTPMLAHFAGYWAVGLPVGYFLCFPRGWGVSGIWTGLCIALILIGASLVLVWRRRLRSLVL